MSSLIKTKEVVKTLGDVLTTTENITIGAAKKLAVPARDLMKFEADVKGNIKKTRDELNKVQIDQPSQLAEPSPKTSPLTPLPSPLPPPPSPLSSPKASPLTPLPSPSLPSPSTPKASPLTPLPSPSPSTPKPSPQTPLTPPKQPLLLTAPPSPPKSTNTSTQTNSPSKSTSISTQAISPPPPLPPVKRLRSPRDKLQLLRILYESLLNTINDLLKHMKSGNNDLMRRLLGYIQILLLQLQHIVTLFNSFDDRMGKLEDRAGLNNRSEPINPMDLEKLRVKLELLRGIPTSPPVKSGWGIKERFFKGFGAIGGNMKKTRKRTPRRTTKRRGTRSSKK